MAEAHAGGPQDEYPEVRRRLQVLEKLRRAHIELGATMMTVGDRGVYATDFVVMGALKRSLDLLDAMTCLVGRRNFTAAAPLLRLQLDSLLRLVYLASVTDGNAVAVHILEGGSFRDLKDEEGRKLTDARLRERARPMYPWLDEVYGETSKLIHFSDKHILQCIASVDEATGQVDSLLGEGVPNWPEHEMCSLLDAMACATDALLKGVLGWIEWKKRAYECRKHGQSPE